MHAPFLIAAAALLASFAFSASAQAPVNWVSFAAGDEQLRGALFLPKTKAPYPAVIALHGCGGLGFRKNGREEDWAKRLNAASYAVLFADSFGSRGLKSQCSVRKRSVRAGRERIADAHAALAYMQSRNDIKPDRISLLGWSNGGATILNSVPTARRPAGLKHDFDAAIAFYPGCRAAARSRTWDTRVRLLILTGQADDWTPPDACIALYKRTRSQGQPIVLELFDGAYHNFDHPNMPVRVRRNRAFSGDGSGVVHQGTHPQARKEAIEYVMRFLKSR